MLSIYKYLAMGGVILAVIAGAYGYGRFEQSKICAATTARLYAEQQAAFRKLDQMSREREEQFRREIDEVKLKASEYENRDDCVLSESDARGLSNIK